jgi:hypothetical protein
VVENMPKPPPDQGLKASVRASQIWCRATMTSSRLGNQRRAREALDEKGTAVQRPCSDSCRTLRIGQARAASGLQLQS